MNSYRLNCDDQPPTSPVTNSVDPDPSGNSEFEKTTVNLGEGKVDSLPDNPVMLIPS
jgi:hypothetical protein